MKVNEVIQYLEPDDQTTINAMISKAGMNGDATIEQLLAAYPHTNPNITRDERSALVSLVYKRPNRFAPKLTFANRCEILALHRKGVPREVLANMYAIDRRTVTHICTNSSPHYKNVRQEEVGLGHRFIEKYLTANLIDKAMAFNTVGTKEVVNNKYAAHKRGIHTVRGPMCTYDHRVVIRWREPDGDVRIAGWYYCDLDGDYPDKWFCVGEESMRTSQACYNAALEDIADKINIP